MDSVSKNYSFLHVRPGKSNIARGILLVLFAAINALWIGGAGATVATILAGIVAMPILYHLNSWKIEYTSDGMLLTRGLCRGLWTKVEPQALSWADLPAYALQSEQDWRWLSDLPIASIFINYLWSSRNFILYSKAGRVMAVDERANGLEMLQDLLREKLNFQFKNTGQLALLPPHGPPMNVRIGDQMIHMTIENRETEINVSDLTVEETTSDIVKISKSFTLIAEALAGSAADLLKKHVEVMRT